MEILNILQGAVKGEIKQNETLAPWTSLKIGGPARYFYIAHDEEEIVELIKVCDKQKLPFFVLGGGSNILISDKGYDGLVIKYGGTRLKIKEDLFECEAGMLLNKAVGESVSMGFESLVWAAGIPGTIGGAVCNNAGAYGQDMGQSVESVKVLRKGKIKKLKNKDCQFTYRGSFFKGQENKDIILSANLRLKRGEMDSAYQRMKETLRDRKEKFGPALTAGSVFKNCELSLEEIKDLKDKFPELPDKFVESKIIPAAWLIDQCELRGKKIGDVRIMANHAGIIENCGHATAEDFIMLVSIIKQKVRSKFSIQLQEEIEYIGL